MIETEAPRESKSVQVAEWFGRKEAWTPDQEENELDSLKRHEMERGSEEGDRRYKHDHLYIREGNADILRIVTRGGDQQRPVTIVGEQYYVDNGKDILMRRYIDQQQAEASRASAMLPNAVQKLQSEHEIFEASLRQQNAILRQILQERERDLRLETQSLPAGTQTDQDAGTQTEPMYLRPPTRKTRSDNDASDISEDDIISAKYSRKKYKRFQTSPIKRKIKTPIQEESENNIEIVEKQKRSARRTLTHGKTNLERKVSGNKFRMTRSALKREVLKEITATLLESDDSDFEYQSKSRMYVEEDFYSDDSINDFTPRTEATIPSSKMQRYSSENDISMRYTKHNIPNKSQSHTDLSKKSAVKRKPKGTSRYMEWYKKGKSLDDEKPKKTKRKSPTRKSDGDKVSSQKSSFEKPTIEDISKEKIRSGKLAKESVAKKEIVLGPEHPLLQHSEHRYEVQYPARRPEEDVDSGIVLIRPAIAQKKSVFTIAYADMHTSQLRPESANSPE